MSDFLIDDLKIEIELMFGKKEINSWIFFLVSLNDLI